MVFLGAVFETTRRDSSRGGVHPSLPPAITIDSSNRLGREIIVIERELTAHTTPHHQKNGEEEKKKKAFRKKEGIKTDESRAADLDQSG